MQIRAIRDTAHEGQFIRVGRTIDVPDQDAVKCMASGSFEAVGGVGSSNITPSRWQAISPRPGSLPAAVCRVSLFLTPDCDMNCGMCSQADYRMDFKAMEMADIKKIITVCAGDKKDTPEIALTGGEPTRHPDFLEVCELVSQAGFEMVIYTNMASPDLVSRALELSDKFKTWSNLANSHRESVLAMRGKHGARVGYGEHQHAETVIARGFNRLPPKCVCHGVAAMGTKIYSCPMAYSLIKKFGAANGYDGLLTVDIDSDWLGHFRELGDAKYRGRICSECMANTRAAK